MIGCMKAEGMETGERVDVNIHMITHGLAVDAFTQSSKNVFALSLKSFKQNAQSIPNNAQVV